MRSLRIVVVASAALAALLSAGATPAAAQDPKATEPTPGSPSGTIYHLPVDSGRSDAAPRPPGGGGGGDGSGGATGTSVDDDGTPGALYRSENNFGASSQVPGAGSANGSSGERSAEADNGGSPGVALAGTSDTGAVSTPLAFVLLAVIVAVGLLMGLGIARSRRAIR